MHRNLPARLALALALALPALAPQRAEADANWKQSNAVWRAMDKCTRDAQKRFPDYTREANGKREAYRQQCLRSANLPGEADPPPQQQPAPQR